MLIRAFYYGNRRLRSRTASQRSHNFKAYSYSVNSGVITIYSAPHATNGGVITII